jgi:hypothetical protein
MITAWAVPAPLPAYIGVSQTTEIPVAPDFADTLGSGLDASGIDPSDDVMPLSCRARGQPCLTSSNQ